MKALLICPAERPEVAALAPAMPLALVPVAGKNVLEYWLEHLAGQKIDDVVLLASDRPEQIRAFVGKGMRWGLNVEIVVEPWELPPHFARIKYQLNSTADWLAEPDDVITMDHLPGLSQYPLFKSYAGWFAGLQAWFPRAATVNRIGVHEIKSGVWAGRRARISPTAHIEGPCWIGESVTIGPLTTIGPMTVLEDHVIVEAGSEISHSFVGPDTMVGKLTEVKHSIAWGNTLINWKTNSCVTVPDPILLCALNGRYSSKQSTGWMGQLTSLYTRNKEDFQVLWKHLLMNREG
jgi:NDP-sugar pyrophosphorylase family protein